MTITNGTVRYNRRIRTGDFEHKDATVELSFTVAEDGDASAALDNASGLARAKAAEMVGEMHAEDDAFRRGMQAQRDAVNGKTPFAPSTVAPVVAPAASPAPIPVKEPIIIGASPAVVEPPKPAADPIVIGATAASSPASPASTSGEIVVVVPVSDADLVKALTAKNAKMLEAASEADRPQVPVKLHTLVHEFVKPPAKVTAIAAERRHEFLTKLAAL